MQRTRFHQQPLPEVALQITWKQWDDGHWEAWVADESGRPPRLVRDRHELARYLEQICGARFLDTDERSRTDW